MCHLKNVVILLQSSLSFVLSRKIIYKKIVMGKCYDVQVSEVSKSCPAANDDFDSEVSFKCFLPNFEEKKLLLSFIKK